MTAYLRIYDHDRPPSVDIRARRQTLATITRCFALQLCMSLDVTAIEGHLTEKNKEPFKYTTTREAEDGQNVYWMTPRRGFVQILEVHSVRTHAEMFREVGIER